MTTEALDLLNKQRDVAMGQLTRIQTFLTSENNFTTSVLELRKIKVEEYYNNWCNIQAEIESIDDKEDFNAVRALAENIYFSCADLISNLCQKLKLKNASTSGESVETPIQNLPHNILPKINIKQFNGDFIEWHGFHDTFKSLVHDSKAITTIHKFHLLKSYLGGDASAAIESLNASEENYLVAWNLLQKRYNNPRKIIHSHLQAIFELPEVTKDSAVAIRSLADRAEMHVNALTALDQPTEWHEMLIYIISSKLDKQSRVLWERSLEDDTMPTFSSFISFLNKISRDSQPVSLVKTTNDKSKNNQLSQKKTSFSHSKRDTHSYIIAQSSLKCSICSQSHFVHNCENFLKLTPQQRLEAAKNAQICINCLKTGHKTSLCKSGSCKKCHGRHNTLLHLNKTTSQNNISSIQTNSINEPSTSTFTTVQCSEVLLSTARIIVLDKQNKEHECRVLLDGGSQSNFMTEKLADVLKLDKQEIYLPASGIGQSQNIIRHTVKTTIKDKMNNFTEQQTFLLLPVITTKLPSRFIDRKNLNIPKNLRLADPEFHKPAEIDMLLGEYIFYKLLCVGQFRLANNTTVLQKTRLGWLVSGKVNASSINSTHCHSAVSLDAQLERFWKLEECNSSKPLSEEETACELHFQNNLTRDPSNGRYTVRLPFNSNQHKLGESYQSALKRWHSLERKFQNNPSIKTEYCAFMDEYQKLGHMSNVSDTTLKQSGFYLPHHAIIKETSLTTKLRVVFDGSAKTSTGFSLNDALMVGPTIQDDVFSLLTRFRTHKYVLTADIEKMYRQINVHVDDANYQKILWRDRQDKPIQIFQLNTVTYGTASAPFSAVRCLKQLAYDEAERFPLASQVLINDFYVDDLITGASTLEQARRLRDDLIQLCNLGGFTLRKWASNNTNLIENMDHISQNTQFFFDSSSSKKTLGIFWDQINDHITYSVTINTSNQPIVTKRTILSQVSQLYDPLGLLGPVIILAKIIIQELWKHKLDWDESVPQSIYTIWQQFKGELHCLNNFKVPRLLFSTIYSIQLHCFCDASERAYGACIYARSSDESGNVNTQLICAKSRVAPLKTISLPRLELCAAVLLTNLYKNTISALKTNFNSVRFWSDSTIVLHWINTSPHKLKTFVSNRVSAIQSCTNSKDWSHVSSADNPADYISRGQVPSEFTHNRFWIHGPEWLSREEHFWPRNIVLHKTDIPEQKTTTALVINVNCSDLLHKFSSFSKLQRVFAYVLRFVSNSRKKTNLSGVLSIHELQESHDRIIILLQGETFTKEIRELQQGALNSKSKLITLNPILDSKGILRVGGRLRNANISFSKKHPILLPRSHHITRSIIQREHIKQMHAGTLATLNSVRQTYWPIDGKNTTRHIIRKCLICFRSKPYLDNNYLMADLPESRFNATKPFQNVGIDYCGPFFIKEKEFRNTKRIKVYVAVFVCFLTKAVHLELVGNLSSEACLSAIKRFVGRRGCCKNIYTDNATNFVGVRNHLKELFNLLKSNEHNNTLATELGSRGINWHFSPPSSPHFGGLWEAAVRSFKHHFVRVVGETLFTYEQLYTYIVEIEAILNSRPLTPLSSDPNDFESLTPNHFLLGESNFSLPEENLTNASINQLSAWKHIQQLKEHFWARWYKEYLNELNLRSKWNTGPNTANMLKEGTLVILKEDNQPPRHWKLGRIETIHPGKDNIVRVVTVKTASGSFKRTVKKVCVLPISQ